MPWLASLACLQLRAAVTFNSHCLAISSIEQVSATTACQLARRSVLLRLLSASYMMLPRASLTASQWFYSLYCVLAISSLRPLMWELSNAVRLGGTFVGNIGQSGSLRAEITGVICL